MGELVVLELSLGPFDLLAPLERCKRVTKYGRRVAREIKLGTQRGPEGESNRTLPALHPLCCARPSLPVHGSPAGQGEGGGAMQGHVYSVLYIRPIKLVDDMNGANQNTAAPLGKTSPALGGLPHHARTLVRCNGC